MIRTHKVVISVIPTWILRMPSTTGVPDARSAEQISLLRLELAGIGAEFRGMPEFQAEMTS